MIGFSRYFKLPFGGRKGRITEYQPRFHQHFDKYTLSELSKAFWRAPKSGLSQTFDDLWIGCHNWKSWMNANSALIELYQQALKSPER